MSILSEIKFYIDWYNILKKLRKDNVINFDPEEGDQF